MTELYFKLFSVNGGTRWYKNPFNQSRVPWSDFSKSPYLEIQTLNTVLRKTFIFEDIM
jgi:hypothetical protein